MTTYPRTCPTCSLTRRCLESWHERLAAIEGFKVGIAWQGSPAYGGDTFRSIPLSHFAPLAMVPAVKLISLQKGFGTEQLSCVAAQFTVTSLGTEIDDVSGPFMDTAAIMQNLDMVIASDSAVAHLAGAMGVPVWVVLPNVADWRWLVNRVDCPWYPTMRLFRQSHMNDWDEVFARVAGELARVVMGDRSRLMPERRPKSRTIAVSLGPGELLDRIAILRIKCRKVSGEGKRRNAARELERLGALRDQAIPASPELAELDERLNAVNELLWGVEDEIRECEARKDFGPRFIELARAVYMNNDERAAIKQRINDLLGSDRMDEKEYPRY